MVRLWCIGLTASLALGAAAAIAKVSEEEAARLGAELTPVGAERVDPSEGLVGVDRDGPVGTRLS